MTIETKSIFSGNGFTTRFIGGYQEVLSGVTGDIVILTPPTGQKVKLSTLQLNNGTSLQSGISISINGVDVITEKTLGGGNSTNEFVVGMQDTSAGLTPARYLSISGGTGEEVKIIKSAGNTTQNIYYAYEFGE